MNTTAVQIMKSSDGLKHSHNTYLLRCTLNSMTPLKFLLCRAMCQIIDLSASQDNHKKKLFCFLIFLILHLSERQRDSTY